MPSEPADWIDISVPIRSGMVTWPGDAPVWIHKSNAIEQGDPANVSVLSMSSHAGTHMDAPYHFIDDGATIDTMPGEATIGPARVIEVDEPEQVTREALEAHDLRAGERVLIKTRNSPRCWMVDSFVEDFIHLSTEAAEHLAEVGVACVGVDYLSVAGYQRNEAPVHEALLEAGIWIIEGLDLSAVDPGPVELVCLPLRLEGGDGAPARAMVRAQV